MRSFAGTGKTLLGMLIALGSLAGCDGGGGSRGMDAGRVPRPEGGVIIFDAAMIGADEGPPPAPDLGPERRDLGRGDRDLGPRDGGGGGFCSGFISCGDLVTLSSCIGRDGCDWDGECRGIAQSCYSQFYSYSCSSQDGCYWSYSTDSCSGSARSCRLYSGGSTCRGQDGCYWDDECTGVATSCSDYLTATSCSGQRGCEWRTF